MANIHSLSESHSPAKDSVLEIQWNASLFDTLSVGAIYTDINGRILHLNTFILKELKIEEKEAIGQQLSDILTVTQDKDNLFEQLSKQLSQGEQSVDFPVNTYIRIPRKNKKFFVKGQVIGQYENEKLTHILFLFRNIETELAQEFIFNLALARTKIFPWFFDIEPNRMTIDERWFTHLGIPAGDHTLSAEEFGAIVHPDDRDMLLNALAQQINGVLNTDSFTYRLQRGDGTYEWFEEQSVYLGKVSNAPYRIVGVCQSIQEHKNVEQNLLTALEKSRESDRLKTAFLANMSHEIRTPLNAIVGFSNLLTSGETSYDTEDAKEYSRIINTNSEQLLRLISDILDLSRIESNTMEFNYSEQSLHGLLAEVYETQILNIPQAVQFILELPEPDVHFITDPMRLQQIMTNLLHNAVKFTSSGSITLGYKLSEENQEVILYVTDTGTGISPDQQKLIFERFYKADSFRPGVGLGLSICKTLVKTLGGRMALTSEPNKGSCFMIHHPLKQEIQNK